jgi:hypothetical protein
MTDGANFVIRNDTEWSQTACACPMDSSSPSCSSCGPWWRLPLLLALVLAAILLLRDRGVRDADLDAKGTSRNGTAGESTNQKVSLAIDFGEGGGRKYEPAKWREGMTVLDLTRETPRPDLELNVQGSGASAFVASLDGVGNEGADGRNWTYTVNGKRGDRSSAIYELRPGDQVLWTFAPQQ